MVSTVNTLCSQRTAIPYQTATAHSFTQKHKLHGSINASDIKMPANKRRDEASMVVLNWPVNWTAS